MMNISMHPSLVLAATFGKYSVLAFDDEYFRVKIQGCTL
jgi:hypothetical protein